MIIKKEAYKCSTFRHRTHQVYIETNQTETQSFYYGLKIFGGEKDNIQAKQQEAEKSNIGKYSVFKHEHTAQNFQHEKKTEQNTLNFFDFHWSQVYIFMYKSISNLIGKNMIFPY